MYSFTRKLKGTKTYVGMQRKVIIFKIKRGWRVSLGKKGGKGIFFVGKKGGALFFEAKIPKTWPGYPVDFGPSLSTTNYSLVLATWNYILALVHSCLLGREYARFPHVLGNLRDHLKSFIDWSTTLIIKNFDYVTHSLVFSLLGITHKVWPPYESSYEQ